MGFIKERRSGLRRRRGLRTFAAAALLGATLTPVAVSTSVDAAGGPVSGSVFVDYTDDHDLAQLTIVPGELAFTGGSAIGLALFATSSILAGVMAIMLAGRSRRNEEDLAIG